MPRSIALLSVLASLAAGPVAAFEFTGATLSFVNRSSSNEDFSQKFFSGDVELSFGSGISAQLGLYNANYDYDTQPNFGVFGYELHLIWRPAVEGLALGAFVGREDFDPYWEYRGIEAKYVGGRFDAEAALLRYEPASAASNPTGYTADHLTLELGYRFGDRYRVFGGYTSAEEAAGVWYEHSYLGGSVELGRGVSIFGSIGQIDYQPDKEEVVMLGVRYDFRNGVTFGKRGYTALLPMN